MVSIHVIDVSSLVLKLAIEILNLMPNAVPADMGEFDLEPTESDVYSHISWRFLLESGTAKVLFGRSIFGFGLFLKKHLL